MAEQMTSSAKGGSASGGKKPVPRKKGKKKVALKRGLVYVNATYNNTIISMTDPLGNVLANASAGKLGFKGPKKSTPYAASLVVKHLAEFVKNSGLQQVDVIIKGVGLGRESAIRGLSGLGLQILSIKDRTPVPHNGPRPRKLRRV